MKILEQLIGWWDCRHVDLRLERYLAGSSDVYDLEYRERKWAYMSESERSRW